MKSFFTYLTEATQSTLLYHATRRASVDEILKHGLRAGSAKIIWASESLSDTREFAQHLDYPAKTPWAVITINAPKGSYFFERGMGSSPDKPGTRVARFAGPVPAAWIRVLENG